MDSGPSEINCGSAMNDESNFNAEKIPLSLTVLEAARILRVDPRTVRDMYRRGEIAGNNHGKVIRLNRDSMLSWLCGKRSGSRSRRI